MFFDSKKMRELRQVRGWRQKDLGDRIGMTQSVISDIERGNSQPSFSQAVKIASELGVLIDQLVVRDGKSPKQRQIDALVAELAEVQDSIKAAQKALLKITNKAKLYL